MDAVCGFCKRGAIVEDICGQLHQKTLENGKHVAAHHKCMQYSALLIQYKFEDFGGFKVSRVLEEIQRGKKLSCSICKARKKDQHPKTGATSGCALQRCNKTYHFYCANVDDTAITKRLVVNLKNSEKKACTVLYRVFCSEEHKGKYVKELKSEKEKLFTDEDSDESSDSESSEEEEVPYCHGNSNRGVTSQPSISRAECTKRPSNEDVDRPKPKRVRELKYSKSQGSKATVKKEKLTINTKNGSLQLPRSLSPVVMLAPNCSGSGTESPTASVESDFSGSTMSYPTSSNETAETPELDTGHRFVLPAVDLSQKLENIPENSVALCVVRDLALSPEEEEELHRIVKSRYGIEARSVYQWHRVVRNHGMSPAHVLHYMADLTENLLDVEIDRFVQWFLCPRGMALHDKYQRILEFQDKLEGSVRDQLDQGICKTVCKSLWKTSKALGWPIGELVPLGEKYALILLLNTQLKGMLELSTLMPPDGTCIWANPSELLFSTRLNSSMSVMFLSRDGPPSPAETQATAVAMKRWFVNELNGPVQVQLRPVDCEIMCKGDIQETSTVIQVSRFLNKVFAASAPNQPKTDVLCVLGVDPAVVKQETYLLKVLSSFLDSDFVPRYALLDVNNVDVNALLLKLSAEKKVPRRQLEVFSLSDPAEQCPTAIIIKTMVNTQQNASPDSTQITENSSEVKGQVGTDTSEKKTPDIPEVVAGRRGARQRETTRLVEDGQVPSTSKHHEYKLKLTRTDSGNWKPKRGRPRRQTKPVAKRALKC